MTAAMVMVTSTVRTTSAASLTMMAAAEKLVAPTGVRQTDTDNNQLYAATAMSAATVMATVMVRATAKAALTATLLATLMTLAAAEKRGSSSGRKAGGKGRCQLQGGGRKAQTTITKKSNRNGNSDGNGNIDDDV